MRKIIIQIFMAILFAMPAIGQTVILQDVEGALPGTVTVNVNMTGFADVGAITLMVDYNGDLLSYTGQNSVPFNGIDIQINPNYGGNSVVKLSWFGAGTAINGTFVGLQFSYSGGFSSDLTFLVDECEITTGTGGPINPTPIFDNGSITPNLTDPDGIASLGTVSANVGDEVSVPMLLIDDGGFVGVASSLSFKVAYDVTKLTYLGISNNTLGLSVGEANGIISLGVSSLTPFNFPLTDPIIKLNFTYLGGGTTAVAFQPGSNVTNNSGVVLNTKFINGAVQLTTPTAGTLTIGKVSSAGATYILPGPTPQDTLWTPAIVSVPITASGITELAGVINLNIAFDNTRLTYSGYTANQITGWVVTSNQSLGTLSFTKTSATALTVNGTVLTLNFDYMYGVADITFEPGTILQKIDGITPIPVNLVDGNVADYSTLNLKVFLEGFYDVTLHAMRKAQDNTGLGNFDKFPGTVADQITVELHDVTTYSTIVWSQSAVNLNTDGTATVSVPRNYAGNYYLTIKHRNHLETVSAAPISFNAATISYDFTDLASKAYGGNQKLLLDGKFAIFAGDFTGPIIGVQDGAVTTADRSAIQSALLAIVKGYVLEDLTGDGSVTSADRSMVQSSLINIVHKMTP